MTEFLLVSIELSIHSCTTPIHFYKTHGLPLIHIHRMFERFSCKKKIRFYHVLKCILFIFYSNEMNVEYNTSILFFLTIDLIYYTIYGAFIKIGLHMSIIIYNFTSTICVITKCTESLFLYEVSW